MENTGNTKNGKREIESDMFHKLSDKLVLIFSTASLEIPAKTDFENTPQTEGHGRRPATEKGFSLTDKGFPITEKGFGNGLKRQKPSKMAFSRFNIPPSFAGNL
jgi:hypothetical protein